MQDCRCVERDVRVAKCQFGYNEVRYRGLANTAQSNMSFAMTSI
jgi:hypothetical protein